MVIYNDLNKFNVKHPVISIGMFDGVHLGHKHIISNLQQIAKKTNGESVLITFSPHPRLFLNPTDSNLQLINTIEEKFELLEKSGVDNLLIIPFTKDFSELTSCQFIENFLVEKIKLSHLVVGYNHRFGKNREGSFKNLANCASIFNFKIEQLGEVKIDNENVSSTKIRKLLKIGNVKLANKYLNYKYFINGIVTDGQKIGRKLGFPTANILIEGKNKLIPGDGVYAVEVFLEEKKYFGMLNIGVRPTISETQTKKSIEVHIFNFHESIYKKKIKLAFIEKIRDEQKFENLEQLSKQLETDKKTIMKLCSLT